jgi:4-diphosphocytidyl-2-C-methyl-D-erythritol kinase
MKNSSLSLKAPAKINWFLKVYGLRNDGYHGIKSLIQKITLYDVLVFAPSEDLTLITDLSRSDRFRQIPIEQNLVYKAAVLLKKECEVDVGAEIRLYKNIPVSAGLGGGSSDAALTLVGLNELWSLGLSIKELCAFAERLGSDVPFFLHGALALVEGRGEKITPLKAVKPFDILLVKPPISVSTRWVYNSYKSQDFGELSRTAASCKLKNKKNSKLITHHSSLSLRGLTNRAYNTDNIEHFIHINDLESVTVKKFPVIADIKRRLLREGAVFSMMSGSGPSVFGVFNSAEKAKDTSKVFKDCWTAVVKTITD